MKICVATIVSIALLLGNSVKLRASVTGPGLVGASGQAGVKGQTLDESNQLPAFTAVRTSPSATSGSSFTHLPFQQTEALLPGTRFDLATGTFTCTVPGTYVFNFSVCKYASSSRLWVHLRKNGGVVFSGGSNDSKHYEQVSGSAVLVLKRGDTVYLTMLGKADSDSRHWIIFSGFLLTAKPGHCSGSSDS